MNNSIKRRININFTINYSASGRKFQGYTKPAPTSVEKLTFKHTTIKTYLEKKDILNQAKKEAGSIISNANKDIEKTIRTIQESKADKKKTKKAREILEKKLSPETVKVEAEIDNYDFKVGDQVQIIDTTNVGEILEIKKLVKYIKRVTPENVLFRKQLAFASLLKNMVY